TGDQGLLGSGRPTEGRRGKAIGSVIEYAEMNAVEEMRPFDIPRIFSGVVLTDEADSIEDTVDDERERKRIRADDGPPTRLASGTPNTAHHDRAQLNESLSTIFILFILFPILSRARLFTPVPPPQSIRPLAARPALSLVCFSRFISNTLLI
ncbi:hypothetical protein FRC00_003203, partial [Tulasnella sp. 408]